MKRVAFIALLVPVLYLAASLAGPLEQVAQAQRGGGGGGVRGGGGGGGGHGGGGGRVGGHSGGGRSGYSSRSGHGGSYGHSGHDGHDGHHGHGYYSTSIWFGPGWGIWDPFYYPYYPHYGYPYYYYAPPTVVVPQEPQEYIMPAPQAEPAGYWYYCREANGYYPYVKRCPGGWKRVTPYTPPPDLNRRQED